MLSSLLGFLKSRSHFWMPAFQNSEAAASVPIFAKIRYIAQNDLEMLTTLKKIT